MRFVEFLLTPSGSARRIHPGEIDMNILHVNCSPRGHAAESHRLARRIVGFLLANEPAARVVTREIGDGTLAHIDAAYAWAQHSARSPVAQEGTGVASEALVRELEHADVVVLGTPMHNLAVPSALKAWIDHVVRAGRSFEVTRQGKVGLLRDRPVYVAIASGGRFSGDRARQPDFLTPYLKAVLGIAGLHDLRFFSVEGTGLGEEALVEERARTDRLLQAHFSSNAEAATALGVRG
jgi:FMN-dependent NADH-azoreductase